MRNQAMVELMGVLLFLPVLVMGGVAYALFRASIEALRWWAGIATVSVPIAAGVGWWVGSREARLQMRGVEMGVEKVAGAAARVVGAVRPPAPTIQESPVAPERYVLPAIVAVPHEEGEVVL